MGRRGARGMNAKCLVSLGILGGIGAGLRGFGDEDVGSGVGKTARSI